MQIVFHHISRVTRHAPGLDYRMLKAAVNIAGISLSRFYLIEDKYMNLISYI